MSPFELVHLISAVVPVFDEKVTLTKSMASSSTWKQRVIGYTPRELNPPDLTLEALENSLKLYVNSKETYAVRRLQRAWRERRHREQGRAWRNAFVTNRAAIKIQQYARRRLACRRIKKIGFTVTIQRLIRGMLARRRYVQLQLH